MSASAPLRQTQFPLAARMARIEPFHVMALLARAKALEAQGRSIVHMEIGEPDFPTPRPVCEAGIAALWQEAVILTGFAIVLISASVFRFMKSLD